MYNPTSAISKKGGQKFVLFVPCGECAECRNQRRTEMYFRTAYEAEYTFRQNGYVLFDTLTYDAEHLPHISDFCNVPEGVEDFSCFNNDDFRYFMVRLRRQLDYHGYGHSNLKYLIASEYGSDKEYIVNGVKKKATQRPHYHVLFFVTNPKLEPKVLSHFINECWQKGKTDGIDYHTELEFRDKIFGPKYCDAKGMRAVANYVAKYVLKDGEYINMLNSRLYKLVGVPNTELKKIEYKKFSKVMKPYCRWSHHFGEYGLEIDWNKDIISEDRMRVPDPKQIWRYSSLSSYLFRKRYYETAYDEKGKLYWRLKDGVWKHMFNRQIKSVESYAKNFREFCENYKNIVLPGETINVYDYATKEWKDIVATQEDCEGYVRDFTNCVVKFLDGRTVEEFAIYVKFYKGRVKSMDQLRNERKGIFQVEDLELFFRKGLRTVHDMQYDAKFYSYCHSTWNKVTNGCKCVGKCDLRKYVDPSIDVYREKGRPQFMIPSGFTNSFADHWNQNVAGKDGFMFTADEFACIMCINEYSDPRFHDFDKLYNLYEQAQSFSKERKQKTYDTIEASKKRMKLLLLNK